VNKENDSLRENVKKLMERLSVGQNPRLSGPGPGHATMKGRSMKAPGGAAAGGGRGGGAGDRGTPRRPASASPSRGARGTSMRITKGELFAVRAAVGMKKKR
jgi:hypothetical protein